MRAAIVPALLVFVMAAVGCGGMQQDIYGQRLDPKKQEAAPPVAPSEHARHADEELLVEVFYLDPGQTDYYYTRYKGGRYVNPFPPGSYAVFSVSIENRTERNLSFNPRMTQLVTEKKSPLYSKDYSTLYVEMELAKVDRLDQRMESFSETCFDTTVTLGPRESVQRLLVFPRVEKAKEGGVLIFNGVRLDHESRTFALPVAADLAPPEP